MRASDIVAYLEKVAPLRLAHDDDLVGFVIGDINRDIEKIGVAWAATPYVIELAGLGTPKGMSKVMPPPQAGIKKKRLDEREVDMLVLHEYPFFEECGTLFPGLSLFEKPPNHERLKSLVQKDTCVYVMHSNLDETEGGTADILARNLGIKVTKKLKCGRVGTVSDATVGSIANLLKTNYVVDLVRVAGDADPNKALSTIGCYVGNGLATTDILEEFYLKGAEALVSSGLEEDVARYGTELGIVLLDMDRSKLERPVMQNLAEKMQTDLKKVATIIYDCEDAVAYL